MFNWTSNLLRGLTGAAGFMLITALPGHAQPAPGTLTALQSEINAEIQDQIAGNARGQYTNGGSLQPKIAPPGAAVSGAATAGAVLGFNYMKVSYCVGNIASTPIEIIVFTDGGYLYTTNPGIFAVLASACPSANNVGVDVTSVIGTSYTWDAFYVFHN